MSQYVGKRISYNHNLCTVRYVGLLPGKGEWTGVEWDDPTLGKHDGCYAESRYFSCKRFLLSARYACGAFCFASVFLSSRVPRWTDQAQTHGR